MSTHEFREDISMEIDGAAHITLTVGDFSQCVAFYRQLLPFFAESYLPY